MARPYAPVDVHLLDSPAIQSVSPLARWVFIVSLLIAKRLESDGVVTLGQVRRDCYDVDDVPAKLAELVDANLLLQDGDTFTLRSWLKWNKSHEELESRRERFAEIGAKGGRRSGEARRGKRDAERDASEHRSVELPENEAWREACDEAQPNPTEPNRSEPTPPQPSDENSESDDKFERALDQVADRQAGKSQTRTTPEAHRAGIKARMAKDGRVVALRKIVDEHPSASAERCVDLFEQQASTW